MRHVTSLMALAILATSTSVQAQTSSNPNQRIPAQRPIAGVVVNEQGQPVPGARLWWGGRSDFMELTADREGRFKAMSPIGWNFVEGPTGLGTIWAEADGFSLSSRTIIGGDEQTRPELDVKVKLIRQRESAAMQLRVVDQQGQPIAQAIVELSPINNTFPPEVRSRFSGRTDADGLMKLNRPPSNAPQLRVKTAAHGTQDFQLLSWTGAPKTPVLRFCPPGSLEVRIVGDPESRRGLQISVHSNGPINSQDSSQENLKLGASPSGTNIAVSDLDSEGRFAIPALVASKVFVEVQSPPESPWLAEMPRQFEVNAGTTTSIEIPMTRGIPVSGRVVDAMTGAPVPGISMTVNGFSVRKTVSKVLATTDRDGRFKAFALPGHAGVQVTSVASSEGGIYMLPPPNGGSAVQVEPDAKEKEFPEIRLTAARRIIGRVISEAVPSVQSWRVTVDKLPQYGMCDEDGYFLLSLPIDLKPQKYSVSEWSGLKTESRVVTETPLILEMLGLVPPL